MLITNNPSPKLNYYKKFSPNKYQPIRQINFNDQKTKSNGTIDFEPLKKKNKPL